LLTRRNFEFCDKFTNKICFTYSTSKSGYLKKCFVLRIYMQGKNIIDRNQLVILFMARSKLPKIFSTKNDFFDPKRFFRSERIFSIKNDFFDQKRFFRPKRLFRSGKIFSTKKDFFSTKNDFFDQKWFFPPKKFFRPKMISSIQKDFFDKKFFRPKMIFSIKKDFLDKKNFSDQKRFFHQKRFFWHIFSANLFCNRSSLKNNFFINTFLNPFYNHL